VELVAPHAYRSPLAIAVRRSRHGLSPPSSFYKSDQDYYLGGQCRPLGGRLSYFVAGVLRSAIQARTTWTRKVLRLKDASILYFMTSQNGPVRAKKVSMRAGKGDQPIDHLRDVRCHLTHARDLTHFKSVKNSA
jgi:hypothetical protein